MANLDVVVRALFEADKRWPTAVKSFQLDKGFLTLNLNTNAGDITMVFAERDSSYRLTDVSLAPKEGNA
jgi:hypothetical protein